MFDFWLLCFDLDSDGKPIVERSIGSIDSERNAERNVDSERNADCERYPERNPKRNKFFGFARLSWLSL